MFTNGDGSHKALITVAVPTNYKDKDGKTTSDYIQAEGFVPADKGLGVYQFMHKGDLVEVGYAIKSKIYKDKDGKDVYDQVCKVNSIELLEPKSTTDARYAKALEEANAAPQAE